MNLPALIALCAILMQAAAPAKVAPIFHWNWNDVQSLRAKQSLRNAQMNAEDKSAIAKALGKVIQPYLSDPSLLFPAGSLQEEVPRTRIEQTDLTGDGVPEVIAQAMVACGATGNCPFWIFQKTPGGYKLLLEDSAETFTIQKTSTSGYKDIVLGLHDSAVEQSLELYQYVGGAYKSAGCYTAVFAVMQDDGVHKLAEPRVTPCATK